MFIQTCSQALPVSERSYACDGVRACSYRPPARPSVHVRTDHVFAVDLLPPQRADAPPDVRGQPVGGVERLVELGEGMLQCRRRRLFLARRRRAVAERVAGDALERGRARHTLAPAAERVLGVVGVLGVTGGAGGSGGGDPVAEGVLGVVGVGTL